MRQARILHDNRKFAKCTFYCIEAVLKLQKKNGKVRSVDIARHMGFFKPSISHAVAVLKDGGFLMVDGDG